MMFTNMYIHMLEVVVALLVVATAVQIFRYYRAFYETTQVPAVLPTAVSHLPNQIENSDSASGNILHDYIGAFFIESTDSAVAKLKDYQVAETIKVKAVEEGDDTVITVMTLSTDLGGVVEGNVMSDEVVHAMLDEAKLICVS